MLLLADDEKVSAGWYLTRSASALLVFTVEERLADQA